MSITLPELPYSTDALVPVVSRRTLPFHHRKHHRFYVENLNKAIDGRSCEGQSLKTIVAATIYTTDPLPISVVAISTIAAEAG